MERIDRRQDFRNANDLPDPEDGQRHEPQDRYGPKDAADRGGAARLKEENSNQNYRAIGTT